MPRLIVILGATGVGKTDLSIQLAKENQCPIVSADSRQIYRDLPIGTAAPTLEEQSGISHYFIGFKSLTETYSAGEYARDCEELLQQLFTKHHTVVMVGGSMMYIDAVCRGLDHMPQVPDSIREEVRSTYQLQGLQWLQDEVQRIDPDYWKEVDIHNPHRLMHCIEITRASGQPYSTFRKSGKPNQIAESTKNYDIEYVMVERPREELYQRINLRVDKMMQMGLLAEAEKAFQSLGIPTHPVEQFDYFSLPNSVNTVGYKELLFYFHGQWTLDKAVEMIKQNSRHYAKRQMTWWRRRQPLSSTTK